MRLLPIALLIGCHGRATDSDTDVQPPPGCRADPGDADRVRAVVVALPYDADGAGTDVYEVLTLDGGELDRPGTVFHMGRAPLGHIVFTPDGSLGVAVQDEGTLGIFTLDADLQPTVIEAGWDGSPDRPFYASSVTMDPTGERIFVLDGNWPNNGGAILEVPLDCETGAPGAPVERSVSKLASSMIPLGQGRAVVVADAVDTHADGDVWLVESPTVADQVKSGAVFFDYEGAIPAGAAVVADRVVLVGDNSMFGDEDNQIGVGIIDGDELAVVDHLPFEDPIDIVASPFGEAALALSGFGDDIAVLAVDLASDPPVTDVSSLDTSGPGVALPGSAVVLDRGASAGLVLVVENLGIRLVQFDGHTSATDEGYFAFGDGLEDIPGAIGVQP